MEDNNKTTPPQSHVMGSELDGVERELREGSGVWRSCTGCHELNEGVPTGPYSSIMKCHLGGGCFECGGIGAIWDNMDYSDYGKENQPARVRKDLSWISSMSLDELRDAVAFLTVDQRETLRKFIWSEPAPARAALSAPEAEG